MWDSMLTLSVVRKPMGGRNETQVFPIHKGGAHVSRGKQVEALEVGGCPAVTPFMVINGAKCGIPVQF